MKIDPDSRMPRRFPTVSSATKPMVSSTLIGKSDGMIEVIAATPAEMETATVTTYPMRRAAAASTPKRSPRLSLATM